MDLEKELGIHVPAVLGYRSLCAGRGPCRPDSSPGQNRTLSMVQRAESTPRGNHGYTCSKAVRGRKEGPRRAEQR
jgi:hypothetical protein